MKCTHGAANVTNKDANTITTHWNDVNIIYVRNGYIKYLENCYL